jgi:hypothetical protein
MSQETGHIQVSFRVPAEEVKVLTEAARIEDRTLSAELRRIIRRAVREEYSQLGSGPKEAAKA